MSLAYAHLTHGAPLHPTLHDVALLAEHHLALRTVRVGRSARWQPQDVTFLISTLDPSERMEVQPGYQLRQLAMLAAARPRLKAQLGAWVVQAHRPPDRDANNLFTTGNKPDVRTWPEGGYLTNVEADSGKYTEPEIADKATTYAQDLNPQVWLACTEPRRATLEEWLAQAIPHIKHEVWLVDWLPDIPSDGLTSTMGAGPKGLTMTPPLTTLQPGDQKHQVLAAQIEAWTRAGMTDVSNTQMAAALKITRGSAINYRNAWQTVLIAEGHRKADDPSVVAPDDVMIFAWVQEQLPWFQERASRDGLLRAFLRGEFDEASPAECVEEADIPDVGTYNVIPDDGGNTATPPRVPEPWPPLVPAPEQAILTPGRHPWESAMQVAALCLLSVCALVFLLSVLRGLPPLSVMRAGPAAVSWYIRNDAKQFVGSQVIHGWGHTRPKARP